MAQIGSILAAEGTDFSHLLKVTIFITELGEIDLLRNILFNSYENNLPASSLVQVKSLFAPGLKIEIEAIVALNSGARCQWLFALLCSMVALLFDHRQILRRLIDKWYQKDSKTNFRYSQMYVWLQFFAKRKYIFLKELNIVITSKFIAGKKLLSLMFS